MWSGPVMAALVLAGGMLFFVLIKKIRASELLEGLKTQVAKRNATIEKGFFTYPRLTFVDGDLAITVLTSPGSKSMPATTVLRCAPPCQSKYKMSIYIETGAGKLLKALGWQDIQVNDPAFDGSFIIKGDNEFVVSRLLTHEVRQQLLLLRPFEPTLKFEGNILTLHIPKLLRDEREFDLLIEAGLLMARGIKAESLLQGCNN